MPIDDIVIKEQPGTERTHFKMPPNTAVDRMDCILAEIQERQQDFLTIICKVTSIVKITVKKFQGNQYLKFKSQLILPLILAKIQRNSKIS